MIAGQENGILVPFATETGEILWLVEPGQQSASAMLQMAENRNVSITWGGRLFGFLILFLGIKLVLNWMAGDIPIIGGLVHGATNVAAAIIAAVAGITVIAISWLVTNPFVGILLLLALVAAFLGARKRQMV